jgi:hypothetical protein
MYNSALYNLDEDDPSCFLEDGAYLFKIADPSFVAYDQILDGTSVYHTLSTGRYHRVHQPAAYCANNIITTLSEGLFHVYRRAIDSIKNRQNLNSIRKNIRVQKALAVIKVARVSDIVYIDARDFPTMMNDIRLCGTMLVIPDLEYDFFHELGDKLRQNRKIGVAYPSARHSQGVCYVFFGDLTPKIRIPDYHTYSIELSLVSEAQDLSVPPTNTDPINSRIHPFMGHYSFSDQAQYLGLMQSGCVFPRSFPRSGYIDFSRKPYSNYPQDAVRSSA